MSNEPITVVDPSLSELEAQIRGRIVELEQKYPVPTMTAMMVNGYPLPNDPMWVAKKCKPSQFNTNKNRPK